MISRVKEYEELYSEFEELYENVAEVEEPIGEIKGKIRKLNEAKKKVNYTDPSVVVGYMKSYSDEQIKKRETELAADVASEVNRLTNPNSKVQKNFSNVSKWISRKKIQDIASKSLSTQDEVNIAQAESTGAFSIFSVLNKIFSYVFRLDFLKFFPKALRIVAAVIVWGIIIIPNMIKIIYNRFDRNYREYLFSLQDSEYQEAVDIVMDKLVKACVIEIALVVIGIIVLNVVIYCLARYHAKQYIIKNSSVCFAILDPKEFEKRLYEQRHHSLLEPTILNWKNEMEAVEKTGLDNMYSNKPDSLYFLVKGDLEEKYNDFNASIDACNAEIESIRNRASQAREKIEDIKPRIIEKQKEVNAFVKDANHNDGVLSPYVSAGFSLDDIEGVKEIVSIKHKYSPVLICYSDETANDIDSFKKSIELLIERLMLGFLQENNHRFMEINLFDFEGLHFPASRTLDIMQVLHTQQELTNFYDKLKEKREMIYSLPEGDGRINNLNPGRLAKRENPIKYNIAFFVGADFVSVDKEIAQLYSVAENIGFIPFVFMRQSVAGKLLREEDKAFSRIIKRISDSDLVYGFENLMGDLEYKIMISNQKALLDQRVPVKKILSISEFEKQAYSDEGFDFDGSLFVDTKGLSESLYNDLEPDDAIKFFTLDGEVPSFVKKEVTKF